MKPIPTQSTHTTSRAARNKLHRLLAVAVLSLTASLCSIWAAGQAVVPTEVGPNHRTWKVEPEDSPVVAQRVSPVQAAVGKVVAIGSGMNYWDGQQWSPSEASFDLTADAFVANKVQHRTRLNADINVVGAVTTTLRDGTLLKSTPVAIALYDPNDGRFAIVSTLTNSTGVLVESNRVVFPEAFRGGVCADVVYTVQRGSLEQDVVITGHLDPQDYNFSTNCQIQIITEFYDAPRPDKRRRPIYVEKDPAVRSRKVSPDRVDEVIGWGEFVIGTGHAYTAPSERNPTGFAAFVSKELVKLPDGRVFLVETVEHRAIQKALQALPACETRQAAVRKDRMVGLAEIPKRGSGLEAKASPKRGTTELAHLADRKRGVTVDYRAHVGGTINETKVFQGDTTWLVVDVVYCAGPVVIEGGAIFKHSRIVGCGATLTIGNTLTLQTSSYRPAIFTAMDDNSIGESAAGYDDQLTGYTGQIIPGGYGNPALQFDMQETATLHDLRFLYAIEAVRFVSEGFWPVYTVAHSQFVNCVYGITVLGYGGGCSSTCGLSLHVQNSLFSATTYPCQDAWPVSISAEFRHCTIDQATVVVNGGYGGFWAYNCIFSRTGASLPPAAGSNNGFHDSFGGWTFGSSPVGSQAFPFREPPVGEGNYYLTASSPFRDAGTTAIDPTLLAEIRKRCTDPPAIVNSPISADTTWTQQIARDTGQPDLGFHYAAVDVAVNATIGANVVLTTSS